ncbi:MAG: hypothetical protein H6661_07450 [Ardenticatenaceae bacterium]|nr:hypothetical protein [Ardenticatenaceae bacterium]
MTTFTRDDSLDLPVLDEAPEAPEAGRKKLYVDGLGNFQSIDSESNIKPLHGRIRLFLSHNGVPFGDPTLVVLEGPPHGVPLTAARTAPGTFTISCPWISLSTTIFLQRTGSPSLYHNYATIADGVATIYILDETGTPADKMSGLHHYVLIEVD